MTGAIFLPLARDLRKLSFELPRDHPSQLPIIDAHNALMRAIKAASEPTNQPPHAA